MTIILDFDDVLFNTARFKEELAMLFKEHKVDFWGTYNRVKKPRSIFSLESYLALAKKENKRVDVKGLEKNIDGLFKNLNQFVFPDVVDFLKNFQNHDLILISWGEKKFQDRKIYSLGKEFISFFDKVITGPTKKAEILDKILKSYKSRPVVFIDDKLEELKEIKKGFKDVILIRLRRNINQAPTGRNYIEAVDLRKAEKIIKNY